MQFFEIRLELCDTDLRWVGWPLAKPESQKAADVSATELMPMPNAFRPVGFSLAIPAQSNTDKGINILRSDPLAVILDLSDLSRRQIMWCGLQMETGSICVRRAAVGLP